ncbi:MAG TPA: HDOD domain-containing protein [Verrucomicrobiae bacterium]
MDLLESDLSNVEEVSDVITFDPALTARILKYCNSACFGFATPVQSVPDAVHAIGFEALKPMLVTACGSTAFGAVDGEALWRRSLLAAFGSKFVAEEVWENSDMIYTAGLLHNSGRLVFVKAHGLSYHQLLAKATLEGVNPLVWEQSTYGINYADVSVKLLEHWNFPVAILDAVRRHLHPLSSEASKSAACVYLGVMLACVIDDPRCISWFPEPELEAVMARLKIQRQDLNHFFQRMKENMNFVEAML